MGSTDLSDTDLWNIDLLDTHLDLLDTDIPSKHFVCLHNVFKSSSGHIFKTCLQYMSLRCLEDVFSITIFRFFQNIFKTFWKTKYCYAVDMLKRSSRPTNVCWVHCTRFCTEYLSSLSKSFLKKWLHCLFPNILAEEKLCVLLRRSCLRKINIFSWFGKKSLLQEEIFAKNCEDLLWGYFIFCVQVLHKWIPLSFAR